MERIFQLEAKEYIEKTRDYIFAINNYSPLCRLSKFEGVLDYFQEPFEI